MNQASGARPNRAARLVMRLGLLGLGGCSVTEHYLIHPLQLAEAAQVPTAEAAHTALPVYRYVAGATAEDTVGKAVWVRAEAVQQGQAGVGGTPFVLRSQRYSPVVTGGVVLTVLGSVISVASSLVFFTSSGHRQLVSGVVALSAEPLMVAGTLMWIMGIQRPPQEVASGQAGVRYLNAAFDQTAPLLLPAPTPTLALRF